MLAATQRNDLDDLKRTFQNGPEAEACLREACGKGYMTLVHWLVTKGANVNAAGEFGETALMLAALNDHLAVVQWLALEAKADVNSRNEGGWTALMDAASSGHLAVVQWLALEAKADVNVQSKDGSTALMLAASNGQLAVVRFLALEAKADVNARNEGGWTALIYAALNGHLAVVQWLALEAKADVNVQSKNGKTAHELAVDRKQPSVAAFLAEAMRSAAAAKAVSKDTSDSVLPSGASVEHKAKPKVETPSTSNSVSETPVSVPATRAAPQVILKNVLNETVLPPA